MTAMMASVRKANLSLQILDSLPILDYIFDSLLLQLADICYIEMVLNQENRYRVLALYRGRDSSKFDC